MKKYAGQVERAFLLFDIYNQNQQHVTLGRVSTFKFPRRTKNSMYYPLIRA